MTEKIEEMEGNNKQFGISQQINDKINKLNGVGWKENDNSIFNKIVVKEEEGKPLDLLFYLQNKETVDACVGWGLLKLKDGKIMATPEGLSYYHEGQFKEPILQEKEPWYKYTENEKGETVGIKMYPGLLGEHLCEENTVVTFWDTLEPYVYSGGVYVQGEPTLIKEIQEHVPLKWVKKTHKNETLDIMKYKTGVDREVILEIIHKNKKYVNLKNGLFNLETWEIEAHRQDFINFSQVKVEYNPEAKCPKFKQFLHEVLDNEEDIQTIQEFFGYTLLEGYPYKKALILYGEGNTGKTTLINILGGILGSGNIASETIQTLTENRFRLAELFGKMANLCPDHPGGNLPNSGVFKAITGNDYISAEKKGKDTFHFRNSAKIIFSANELPKARDTSDAFYSRFIIISFSHVFSGKEIKKDLDKKLVEEEAEGILAWLLKGLKRLLDTDKFSISPSTEIIREEYIRKSNPVASFFMDCIEEEEGEVIIKSELYSAYISYCRENKLPTLPENIFGKEIIQQSGYMKSLRKKINGNQQHVWVGVRKKTQGLPRSEDATWQRKEDSMLHNSMKTKANQDVARVATLKHKSHACEQGIMEGEQGIIEKCYKSAKIVKKQEKEEREVKKHGNPGNGKISENNLSDKQDKSAKMKKVWDILKSLDVVPGEKGRIDAEQLLLIFNHEGFTTTEAIEAIEEAGGIQTEPLGEDTLYDFTSSLAVRGGD